MSWVAVLVGMIFLAVLLACGTLFAVVWTYKLLRDRSTPNGQLALGITIVVIATIVKGVFGN